MVTSVSSKKVTVAIRIEFFMKYSRIQLNVITDIVINRLIWSIWKRSIWQDHYSQLLKSSTRLMLTLAYCKRISLAKSEHIKWRLLYFGKSLKINYVWCLGLSTKYIFYKIKINSVKEMHQYITLLKSSTGTNSIFSNEQFVFVYYRT